MINENERLCNNNYYKDMSICGSGNIGLSSLTVLGNINSFPLERSKRYRVYQKE
jgi:hypothetical protein